MHWRPDRISDSQREKARTNHNQAHDNDEEKTGRGKILAHDDTYASIGQSGEPEPPALQASDR